MFGSVEQLPDGRSEWAHLGLLLKWLDEGCIEVVCLCLSYDRHRELSLVLFPVEPSLGLGVFLSHY